MGFFEMMMRKDFDDVSWGMALEPPWVSLKASSWKNLVGDLQDSLLGLILAPPWVYLKRDIVERFLSFVVGDDLGTPRGYL